MLATSTLCVLVLQGLVAGVNAARRAQALEPVVFPRNTSYIGTLIDDLVTKVQSPLCLELLPTCYALLTCPEYLLNVTCKAEEGTGWRQASRSLCGWSGPFSTDYDSLHLCEAPHREDLGKPGFAGAIPDVDESQRVAPAFAC